MTMPLDVNDLVAFYASPLGDVSRRLIGRVLRARWEQLPRPVDPRPRLLRALSRPLSRRGAARARLHAGRAGRRPLAGAADAPPRRWSCATCCRCPTPRSTARWSSTALETAEHPERGAGGGLARAGAGRAGDRASCPRGAAFGRASTARRSARASPIRKGAVARLMREALFSPVFWGEALYAPPFRRKFFVNSAPAIERVGAAIGLPFAGVHDRRGDQAGLPARSACGGWRAASSMALAPGLAPVAHRDGPEDVSRRSGPIATPRGGYVLLSAARIALLPEDGYSMPQSERLLVLLRHGQSEWNLKNLFTGWKDPDLTPLGVEEAKDAGRRLKARGLAFDVAFTSALTRAQHTLDLDAGRTRPDRPADPARPGAQRARLRRSVRAQQGRRAQEVGRGAGPSVAAQLRRAAARRRKPEGHGRARAALLLPEHPARRAARRARARRRARQQPARAGDGARPPDAEDDSRRWSSRPACRWSTGSRPIRPSRRRKC